MDISQLNSMDRSSFQDEFGNIFEHRPEAANYCFSLRPFTDKQQVVDCFTNYVDRLTWEDKLQMLKNQTMLGSKKPMSTDSENEHRSAGLNDLPDPEADTLERMNQKYFDKFGFPYIVCVAESTKEEILNNIQSRIANDLKTEVLRGIAEVKKIAKHRIQRIIK